MKKKTIGYKGKSGVGTLNATQETPSLYKTWFLKKSRRTIKNCRFGLFWLKWVFFEVLLDFFRNHALLGAGVFCVAFRASGRFF